MSTPTPEEMERYKTKGFGDLLGIQFESATPEHAEASMPITDKLYQPFGFVHGGVTLALLETVGSFAAILRIDPEAERAFGIHMDVRHFKPGKSGTMHATADLEKEEGSKQFWHVRAYDDEGDTISEGTFTTKVVSKEYLAKRHPSLAGQI